MHRRTWTRRTWTRRTWPGGFSCGPQSWRWRLPASRSRARSPRLADPAARAAALAPWRSADADRAGHDSDKACEPGCPEWISAEGVITPGRRAAFARLVASLGGRRLAVLISSHGGSLRDALEMGVLIRAKGLAVAVARTLSSTARSGRAIARMRGASRFPAAPSAPRPAPWSLRAASSGWSGLRRSSACTRSPP